MNKRPAFMWYPGDFRRDTALQACSFEARGLWREMLDLMHDGEPYGHFTAGGVPITAEQLARIAGIASARCRRYVDELEKRRVFDRTPDGVIFSRRMVRDEHIRNVRAAAGKLGGNPNLSRKTQCSELLNQTDKQTPTPAVALAVAENSPPATPARFGVGDDLVQSLAYFPAIAAFAEVHERRQTLERFASRVRAACGDDALAGYIGEVNAALEGKHGPARTPDAVHLALADWCDNNAPGNKNLFRRYLANSHHAAAPRAITSDRRRPARTSPIADAGAAAAYKLD